jgi:hypothetical protein
MIDPILAVCIWAAINIISSSVWLYITYRLPSLAKEAGIGIIFHIIALCFYFFELKEVAIIIGICSLFFYFYPITTLEKKDIKSKIKDPWGMYNMLTVIFDTIPFPVFIKDANLRVIMVNKSFTHTFGLTIEDFDNMSSVDQGLIWGFEEAKEFRKSDLQAVKTDDTIIKKMSLFSPKPDSSELENPERPYEYIIIKKSYRLSHFGGSKGVIGMAINSDMIDARMAEIENLAEMDDEAGHVVGEIKQVIGLLHQMDKKMDGVIVRVGFLEQRNEAHHHHIRKNNEILEKLLKIRKDIKETISDTDETWDQEIDPYSEKKNDNIDGVS